MLSEEALDSIVVAVLDLVHEFSQMEIPQGQLCAEVSQTLGERKRLWESANLGLITQREAALALMANVMSFVLTVDPAARSRSDLSEAGLQALETAMFASQQWFQGNALPLRQQVP